jgi:hypothetical protein
MPQVKNFVKKYPTMLCFAVDEKLSRRHIAMLGMFRTEVKYKTLLMHISSKLLSNNLLTSLIYFKFESTFNSVVTTKLKPDRGIPPISHIR